MKYLSIIIVFLSAISTSNCNAQKFIYKKKIEKHVFKPQNGKLEKEYSFDEVQYLTAGTWIIQNNGKYGIFNRDDKVVLPILFDKIDFYSNESNLVNLNGKWGIYKNKEFLLSNEILIFRNPDQRAKLKECISENDETNQNHDKCFLQILHSELKLPKSNSDPIVGQIVAEIVIDSKGNTRSTKILRSLDESYDKALIDLLNSRFQEWSPAINEGKFVNSRVIVPIKVTII